MTVSFAVQRLFSSVRSHLEFVSLNTGVTRILFLWLNYIFCLCHILGIYTFADVLGQLEIKLWIELEIRFYCLHSSNAGIRLN